MINFDSISTSNFVTFFIDGGDKDVRDIIQMRIEKRRRDGTEDTPLETDGKIGEFERHTKVQ